MSVIFIVLPLALLVVLAAAIAFHWAARRGQFDDLGTPALRMLHEDEPEEAGEAAARSGAGGEPREPGAGTDGPGGAAPADELAGGSR